MVVILRQTVTKRGSKLYVLEYHLGRGTWHVFQLPTNSWLATEISVFP